MAIKIIPEPTIKPPFWLNFLFYFSLALILFAIVGYFSIRSFVRKDNIILEELEKKLAEPRPAEEEILREKLLEYQEKIKDFSFIFEKHYSPSQFFGFFEALVHPNVWFSSISLNPREVKVELSGKAESFIVLGQQILILQAEKRIKDISLTGISIGDEGAVNFKLAISFSPEILEFREGEIKL